MLRRVKKYSLSYYKKDNSKKEIWDKNNIKFKEKNYQICNLKKNFFSTC